MFNDRDKIIFVYLKDKKFKNVSYLKLALTKLNANDIPELALRIVNYQVLVYGHTLNSYNEIKSQNIRGCFKR